MSLVSSQPAHVKPFSHAYLLHTLCAIGQSPLISCGDFRAAALWICQQVHEALDLEGCGVWLLKKNGHGLQPVVCWGNLVPPDEVPTSRAASSSSLHIDTPLSNGDSVIGIMRCYRRQAAEKDWEWAFIASAASWIAVALNRSQHQRQIEGLENQLILAADAWQESQHFLQSILEFSSCILYVNDFDSGRNEYLNTYGKRVLGYSKQAMQQIGGSFLEELIHPQDLSQLRKARANLLAQEHGALVESEYRVKHQEGRWCWLLCRETVFQRDENNIPTQIFGTATDITARKEHEKELNRLNHKLERLANLDGLTQVANRRAFDAGLSSHCSDEANASIALILCDIDYFKSYNDHYGHQAGDECLRKIARVLTKAVQRDMDIVARYGGEEFAIVLPVTSLIGAIRVAENVLTAVSELNIPHQFSLVSDHITLSLGITAVDSRLHASPQQLVEAADRGLYRAKYNGRACYCVESVG